MNKDLTLLVLAAGMGSRYGGLKQVDPMGPHGETLLDYSVYDALQAGFNKVVFVIRRDFEQDFRERVASRYENRISMDFAFQQLDDLPPGFAVPVGRQKPWGTGHAILAARKTIQEPFLAINADDFYGSHSYELMAAHLREAASGRYAMAGYRLRKTLSEHGTVSRGVCTTGDAGKLKSVREFTTIEKRGEAARDVSGGIETIFTGDEPVSLNFWGFTPDVFGLLEAQFRDFLEAQGGELKSEFYIPSAVAEMISREQASVDVLPTESVWFGITYREDKPGVVAKLQDMSNRGVYPSPLWK